MTISTYLYVVYLEDNLTSVELALSHGLLWQLCEGDTIQHSSRGEEEEVSVEGEQILQGGSLGGGKDWSLKRRSARKFVITEKALFDCEIYANLRLTSISSTSTGVSCAVSVMLLRPTCMHSSCSSGVLTSSLEQLRLAAPCWPTWVQGYQYCLEIPSVSLPSPWPPPPWRAVSSQGGSRRHSAGWRGGTDPGWDSS